MRVLAVSILALALGGPAFAQTQPAKSPSAACHADGKAKSCVSARRHSKKTRGDDGLRAQSFTHCRDVRTHSPTRCGGPYAEPLPTD